MSIKGIKKKDNPDYVEKRDKRGRKYYKKKDSTKSQSLIDKDTIFHQDTDFSAPRKKNLGVSHITSLCEDAMCSGSDIDNISRTIASTDNSNRVIALRNLDEQDIKETLQDWKEDMISIVSEKFDIDESDISSIRPGNDMGNFGSSDLIIVLNDGRDINVETKFGRATNSAIGLSRMNEVLSGEQCFSVNVEDKQKLVNFYLDDPKKAKEYLTSLHKEYIDNFNQKNITVNSQVLTDIITSSGLQGNSASLDNYIVVNLKAGDKGAYATETPLTINNEDVWEVNAQLGEKGKNTRIDYIFTSDDGQKRIKMTYNNKNSAYVDTSSNTLIPKRRMKKLIDKGKNAEDFMKIESNYQLSTGSYNVWYKEGLLDEN